ncbi:MAG: SufD family Fe-S cluster assembly protein [Acidobacteriota bacterium]
MTDSLKVSAENIREQYLKKFTEIPLFESSVIKVSTDFKNIEHSSFKESFNAPSEYSQIEEVSSISYSPENIFKFEREFIEPKSGFGYYALSQFEKIMFLKCKNSEKNGFIKIESGKGLSIEPLFIDVPPNTNSSIFVHFDLSRGDFAFNLIRARIAERGNLSLYLLFENFKGRRFVDFSSKLGRESCIEVYPMFLEGDVSFFRSSHEIKEEKSTYKEKLIALLKNREKGDFKTVVAEESSEAKVNVEARGVLKDSARAFVGGLLKVKKEAVKSSSLYSAHCLKLSQNSRADVEPNLEIEALDVTASHSASVAPVDDEKLFYLESRGLNEEKAKKEVSSGFLFALIEKNDFVKEKIEENL